MKRSKKRPNSSLKVSEDIVPIAEMKTHFSERIRELRDRGRPYVVTQNGKPAAVMLSPEEFDRLNYEIQFLSKIYQGLEDVEAGRVLTDEELTRYLDEGVDALPKLAFPKPSLSKPKK